MRSVDKAGLQRQMLNVANSQTISKRFLPTITGKSNVYRQTSNNSRLSQRSGRSTNQKKGRNAQSVQQIMMADGSRRSIEPSGSVSKFTTDKMHHYLNTNLKKGDSRGAGNEYQTLQPNDSDGVLLGEPTQDEQKAKKAKFKLDLPRNILKPKYNNEDGEGLRNPGSRLRSSI